MQRRLTGILLGLFIALCALPGASRAAATSPGRSVEAKVTLEASLERRLVTVLQKVLGTTDLVVIVNAELQTEFGDDELMPGVPLKDTPADPARIPSRTLIKNISAVIIVDEAASEKDIALARKTAAGVLGIDPGRGDNIQVDKMPLTRAAVKNDAPAAGPPPTRWTFDTIVSVLWLVTAAVGLLMLYGAFLKPMLSVAKKFAAAAAAPAQPSPLKGPQLPAELEGPQIKDEPAHTNGHSDGNGRVKADLPFSFVAERSLPMLSFLLKRQTPRVCAVVCHYLPARMAAELLIGMKGDKRAEVVQQMSRVTQLQESEVKAIETNVRSKIDYLMGGEDKLADILEEVPVQLQEELLGAVERKDPDVGRRLGRRIIMLEDIALLDGDDLKTLSRRVQLQSLAAVLKEQPGLREKLMPKLTSGLGQWLNQEIELSQALAPERLAAEQRKVLHALSSLVREGKIRLNKEVDGAAAPPDDLAAAPPESEAAPFSAGMPETAAPFAPAPEPVVEAEAEGPAFAPPTQDEAAPEAFSPPPAQDFSPPEPAAPATEDPAPPPAPRIRPPRPSLGDWAPKEDQPPHQPRPRPLRPKLDEPEGEA